MNLHNLITIVIMTLLPGLELRLSIPWGVGTGIDPSAVFVVAVLTNIALGPVVYFALIHFVQFFLRFNLINNIYEHFVLRTRKRVFPLVEKYGLIGISLFVAIPLPGSGSYTGALAAYLLGLSQRRFAVANLLGVLIAGLIVTLVSIGVFNGAGM